jgi:phage tail sheath protein FI
MANTYLSPGVYPADVDRGPRPIEGVNTSVPAFIGFTEKGPVNEPTLVTSWLQFEDTFGEFLPGAFLPYCVFGFFGNGGETCYVLRLPTSRDTGRSALAPGRAVAELPARKPSAGPSLLVTAKLEGDAGAAISVEVREGAADDFTLIAHYGTEEEVFSNVTLGLDGETTITTVNEESRLLQLEVMSSSAKLADRIPVRGIYPLNLPRPSALKEIDVSLRTFRGDVTEREGIGGLEVIEEITIVAAPDLMSAYLAGVLHMDGLRAAQSAIIAHCENMGDRVAILDSPPGLTPLQIAKWRRDEAGYDSKYAALYYPWIETVNAEGKPLMLPPSGHVAGIWARVDRERGVHSAPANELVHGALGLGMPVSNREQDILNPMGINCIREFPGRGIRIWGARLLSSDPAWRYINVRRLFNYIEESIREGTQWVVFEPNGPLLWGQVTLAVSAFLRSVWRGGALLGAAEEDAFYVKCDEELNPPEMRDQGQLIIEIGIAPVKPAEFIVFRISQWAGGAAGGGEFESG